jgi:hypothetical protein
MLISRFMLNLRQANETSDGATTHNRSTIRFDVNNLVGNMGESLQFGTRSYDDDTEDSVDENIAAR